MANGLRINISESEFKSKPTEDQNWVLYQAITKIDEHGCSWSIRHYKEAYWKKLSVLGGSIGGGLGFAFMAGKALKLW